MIRRTVFALITLVMLILSGSSSAYAPVSSNLQQPAAAAGDGQAAMENPQLIIDGTVLDLTQLLNSEVPLFNHPDAWMASTADVELNLVEKRLKIRLNQAHVGLQLVNTALDRTENAFALRCTPASQAALVVEAPGIDFVDDFSAKVTTTGQGMNRVCYLLNLKDIDGRVIISDMERVSLPRKTAAYTYIVSEANPLTRDFVSPGLVSIPGAVPAYQSKAGMQLNSQALSDLDRMLVQAQKEGIGGFVLSSTYRPYSYQSMLFANKTAQLGSEAAAARIVARPGTSEHQTGLAVDFAAGGAGLTEDFAFTPQGRWLSNNSWKYGFILRYPADKTDITRIIYEPWHFRYVGYPYSKIIFDRGLCLEEFHRNLSQYGFYAVADKDHTYIVVHNSGDGKVYLSEAVPR